MIAEVLEDRVCLFVGLLCFGQLIRVQGHIAQVDQGSAARPLVAKRFGDNVVWHEGLSGDFANNSHRWDVAADPRGGSVVMLTGGSDYNRAGWITRRLMERDPWLMAGFAGSWKIVWLRNLLRGV